MTSAPVPLSEYWRDGLDLTHRLPPELFQSGDDVRDTPYVSAVRTALEELSLSAVFCVNRVPTVVFRQSPTYEPREVGRIHAALWNQGLASIFIDLTEDTVRVFSLARVGSESPETNLETSCLLKALTGLSSTLDQVRGFISGSESGRLWHERRTDFRPDERIDAVLLNNLAAVHHRLMKFSLSPDQAAAALIQTMFVAYLEDREIIRPTYFETATEGKYTDWASLLDSGDVEALDALFSHLYADFNGDLFVAPCSFSDTDTSVQLTADHLKLLKRFRVGREKIARSGIGQPRFWGYDFRYIPVALISEVYDQFLRQTPMSQRSAGAYYTPMFLADMVVSSTWSVLSDDRKDAARYLDPACGSGVFLVKTFQRLCQHWRERYPDQTTIPWEVLTEMLHRVRGKDLNPIAVRISAFSLYLALLEQVRPPELRRLIASGRRLPTLWNQTLRAGDFFLEHNKALETDVVIGNPPWYSRKRRKRTEAPFVQWSQEHGYPIPSVEAAWAFTWKGLEHLPEDGILAFILPAMGLLHNQAQNCIDARARLFSTNHVQMVVNFSDLRFQLFTSAVGPATLIVLRKSRKISETSYEFTYLTPKADPNLRAKRFVSLTTQDKTRIHSVELIDNPRIFKERLWMRASEVALFRYLARLPRLSQLVTQYAGCPQQSSWRIGVGFQPWHEVRTTGTPVESRVVGEIPYLPVRRFAPLHIDSSGLVEFPSTKTRRRGFESAFRGTRILIRRGIRLKSMGRMEAAFVTRPLTFDDSIMGITVPSEDRSIGKFVTAYLNSRLALWFAFHGTASFGAYRPLIKAMDVVALPLPLPHQVDNSEASKCARAQLVELVDDCALSTPGTLDSQTRLSGLLSEIDKLVYAYFNLNDDEIALVDEAVECTLPALQPSRDAFPSIWQESTYEDRKKYADALRRRLANWFADDCAEAVRMVARNSDVAVIEVGLKTASSATEYTEESSRTFSEVLTDLTEQFQGLRNSNFMLTPDVRIFAGSKLYLVKPLQRRYWLLSAAVADADAIVQDLDSQWQQGASRSSRR